MMAPATDWGPVMFGLWVVALVLLMVYMKGEPRRRMARAAEALGFQFTPEDSTLPWSISSPPPVVAGHIKLAGIEVNTPGITLSLGEQLKSGETRIANVVRGFANGTSAVIFDCVVKNNSTRRYAFQFSMGARPPFILMPSRPLFKIDGAIELEASPEFSSHHLLLSPEPEAVRALFKPALADFLEQQKSERAWQYEVVGGWLVINPGYARGRSIPDTFQKAAAIAAQFQACLPR